MLEGQARKSKAMPDLMLGRSGVDEAGTGVLREE